MLAQLSFVAFTCDLMWLQTRVVQNGELFEVVEVREVAELVKVSYGIVGES